MTAPVAHGYPDWGRATPAADVIFYQQSGVVADNPVTLGPYFVGAQPAVGIFFRANVFGFQVRPVFYPDRALTAFLASQFLHLARAGVEFWGAIRTLGPWMTLEITPSAGPGGTFDATVWSAPAPAAIFTSHPTQSLINSRGNAIAIGGTGLTNATRVHLGMAHLYLAQRAGTWTGTLYSVDYTGTRVINQSRNFAAGEYFDEIVPLMPGTPQVEVINTSGVAATWDAHLVAVPNLAG